MTRALPPLVFVGLALGLFPQRAQAERKLDAVVRSVLRPPAVGAPEVLVLEVELNASDCHQLRVRNLTLQAFRKPGDPTTLQVRSADGQRRLSTLALSEDRRLYAQTLPMTVPADCAFGLWASTNENWGRLVSRRKLSRLLSFDVVDSNDAALPLELKAVKRPKGRLHEDDANHPPSHLGTILPSAVATDRAHVWRLPAGEHRLTDDRVIPRGAVLEIAPGAVIRLAVGRSLVSYGTIIAVGTPDAPIVFTSLGEAAFGSVALMGFGANGSTFERVRFERGSQAWSGTDDLLGTLDIRDTKATIDTCEFAHTRGEDALHVLRGQVDVTNTRFDHIASDAVDYDSALGTLTELLIQDVGDDALDAGQARLTIERVVVKTAGGKALTAGTDSKITLKMARFFNLGRGISAFDGAVVEAEDVAIVGAKRGALQAHHRDGEKRGQIRASDILLWNNGGELEGQAEGRIVLTRVTRDRALAPDDVTINVERLNLGADTTGAVPVTDHWWLLGALVALGLVLAADYRARLSAPR